MSTAAQSQPQPPRGLDEDVEPRARQHNKVKCHSCKENIFWDGEEALWCENKNCSHHHRVYWNADLKQQLSNT